MTLAEQWYGEATAGIRQARRAMERLAQTTADRQARIALECEFKNIEETVQEFVACQFGISKGGPV